MKYEICSLLLKEKYRYYQVRALGITIPKEYKRVPHWENFDRSYLQALVQVPEINLYDSDREDDDQVLKKYSKNPIPYLSKYEKMRQVEKQGPWRYYHCLVKKNMTAEAIVIREFLRGKDFTSSFWRRYKENHFCVSYLEAHLVSA